MQLFHQTPLIESRRLATLPVWLKLENTQPTGSFKARGIGFACQEYARKGAKRFVSSSGGNAGVAVAYSGRRLGVPVTVIVPETTTEKAKELIRSENAELIVHGASWSEAHAHAGSFVGSDGAYLHPFDDPLIWAGHATVVTELAMQRDRPDAIVVSVGGGGLYSGVVLGCQQVGWGDLPIIAVETNGADSLHQALKHKELVQLQAITSIATSLGAKQVAENALEQAQHHPTHSVVMSDREAIEGCRKLLDAHHMLVEPACGVAISAGISCVENGQYEDVVVIVCGGVGVTDSILLQWEQMIA